MNGLRASPDQQAAEPFSDSRRRTRSRVIKSAKILFAGSVIDCVVQDVSVGGAKVRTPTPVAVPEKVVLQVLGGAAFSATRRWSRGLQIGFDFEDVTPLDGHAGVQAATALDALPSKGLARAMEVLERAGFFDDPDLHEAARQAEAAYSRFETALRSRVHAKSS